MDDVVQLDGSVGEGGGQILRTAVALSLVTQRPFRLVRIRAGRSTPGLAAQHLASVHAAARIGAAEIHGAELRSQELTFRPSMPSASGVYRFTIDTAGSTMLVLQTVVPALLLAAGESTVEITGGTHAKHAPMPEFIEHAFAPVIEKMGGGLRLEVVRHGFYPRGGGLIRAVITPAARLRGVDLTDECRYRTVTPRCLLSRVDPGIAAREVETVSRLLTGRGIDGLRVTEPEVPSLDALGQVSALVLLLRHGSGCEVVSELGERGFAPGEAAARACQEAKEVIEAGVAVGPHLADQIILPMALAAARGGGASAFATVKPTCHTETNMQTIRAFLPVELSARREAGSELRWRVHVGPERAGSTK